LALALLIPRLQAGARHPFSQAAILEERFFKPLELPVKQEVGLVNQTEAMFATTSAGLVSTNSRKTSNVNGVVLLNLRT
jgi:hypothetical protein